MNEIEKAIRHFENMRNENIVVLNTGFGDKPNEHNTLYANRKLYADLAIQALQEKQEREWIKFETEIDEEDGREIFCCPIPDDEQDVLITDGKNVWLDMFCNDGNDCWFDSGFDFDKITHWQPLPEPPKQCEENG